MTYSKVLVWILVLMTGILSVYSEQVYNEDGEFRIIVDDRQDKSVYNDDIKTSFTFTIENTLDETQRFDVKVNRVSGWNIDLEKSNVRLSPGETEQIIIDFEANSDFDYSPQVVSPDLIKISQKEDYVGNFRFPIYVIGETENVSMKFSVAIEQREILPIEFDPQLATRTVSPTSPFQFSIKADNIEQNQRVEIKAVIGDYEIVQKEDLFSSDDTYKIYSRDISNDVVPGNYPVMITVRQLNADGKSAKEWFEESSLNVLSYEQIVSEESFQKGFFTEKIVIELSNEGNVQSSYTKDFTLSVFKKFLLSSNEEYEKTSDGISYSVTLEKGESKTIQYTINYLPVYLLLIVIVIIFSYIYIRKASNPLDVETKLYEIKKVKHEGVKSMKVRIGFENLKIDEIDTLKVIFRMPSYLQVRDDSFLLAPPKHALKGRDQYKLIWEFKRFERKDSRILGFTLVNNRGVLGDVKLPPLEVEVKVGGKIRRYYEAFPTIKG